MGESLHHITNWPQYNSTLINRGSLTFWIDADAMNNWFHHGRRGRSRLYTDQTVRTFLMLKGIFNLTLRATQRLLDTLFALMNALLCAPDYGCVSKRARPVKVAYRQPAKGRITDLVIDSTGLKVFGEGEWKVRKHGTAKCRVHAPVQKRSFFIYFSYSSLIISIATIALNRYNLEGRELEGTQFCSPSE